MEKLEMRVSQHVPIFPLVASFRGFILTGFSRFWDLGSFPGSEARPDPTQPDLTRPVATTGRNRPTNETNWPDPTRLDPTRRDDGTQKPKLSDVPKQVNVD